MKFITDHLLAFALPLIVAPLTVIVGKIVLNAHAKIDALPAWAKQGAVIAVAAILTSIASLVGADICSAQPCAGDFSNLDIKALVSALLAFALHQATKPSST